MEPLVIASTNESKALQIATLFAGTIFEIETQTQAGVQGEAEENRHDRYAVRQNAICKAEYARVQLPGRYILSDDTGLFIDAFHGLPGAQAAYWGGGHLDTEARMHYALARMKGVSNRWATFRTVVVLMTPEGQFHTFNGDARGILLEAPRCPPQPKMPYSSIFQPEGEALTWAEMTTEYKNRISHRGKAFAQAKEFLQRTAA